MRLPRIGLRLPRLSFDWASGVGQRRFVFYAVYTIVLFAVFLIVNFPHDVVVRRALRELDLGPLHLDVAATRFAWIYGYELRGVALTGLGPDESTAPPLLEAASLYVRPALRDLLAGQLSAARVNGSAYGGDIEGRWAITDGIARMTANLRSLQLGRSRWITGRLEEGEVAGRLSGVLTLESRRGNLRGGQAAGELGLEGTSFRGTKINGFTVPDIQFDAVALKFALQGGRLEVQRFGADSDQVRLTGTGHVVLRDPVADSVLNLRVTVEPGDAATDAVKGLLALLPPPADGRSPAVFISGTLARPRVR